MKKLAISLLASSIALIATGAHASDGEITIKGRLTAQTCTINGNGSGGTDFTVPLPRASTTTLRTLASTAGDTGFNITLSGCNPDTGSVRTYFDPTNANTNTDGRLNNTGAATNVDVQLLNASDISVINLKSAEVSQNSRVATISGGNATLQYIARYYSRGNPTAGNVSTSVTYTMSYQ